MLYVLIYSNLTCDKLWSNKWQNLRQWRDTVLISPANAEHQSGRFTNF